MKHTIIEIKAYSDNNEKIREILKSKNAIFSGTDHQIDTYFNVENGRLKLREGNIENSLIHYFRDNKEAPKESDVILYKNGDHSILKELLTRALGTKVIVDKVREIYFIDNVKIHLDKIETLGEFVEVEAIGNHPDESGNLLKQCEYYLDLFEIQKKNLVSYSYSDLLIQKKELI